MVVKKKKLSSDWWKSNGGFFGKFYLEADDSYEGFLNSPKAMDQRINDEVNGVIKLCGLKKQNKILDAPCGYGRHSVNLSRKGMNVMGVDINEYFLAVAKKQTRDLKLNNCRFYRKDLRKLSYRSRFDAVINMFYSFGFFEDENDDFRVIYNFYKSLKKGGKFLMHTFITLPKIINGNYKIHDVRNLTSGNKLELYRDYDFKTKREYGEWYVLQENSKKIKLSPYSMRIYTDLEFIGLCTKVGFSRVDIYGNWQGRNYNNDSELMIVVATK